MGPEPCWARREEGGLNEQVLGREEVSSSPSRLLAPRGRCSEEKGTTARNPRSTHLLRGPRVGLRAPHGSGGEAPSPRPNADCPLLHALPEGPESGSESLDMESPCRSTDMESCTGAEYYPLPPEDRLYFSLIWPFFVFQCTSLLSFFYYPHCILYSLFPHIIPALLISFSLNSLPLTAFTAQRVTAVKGTYNPSPSYYKQGN